MLELLSILLMLLSVVLPQEKGWCLAVYSWSFDFVVCKQVADGAGGRVGALLRSIGIVKGLVLMGFSHDGCGPHNCAVRVWCPDDILLLKRCF